MKDFLIWLQENNEWQQFVGQGYRVNITQYSNKGPLFIIENSEGQEISRAYFDLTTNNWKGMNNHP